MSDQECAAPAAKMAFILDSTKDTMKELIKAGWADRCNQVDGADGTAKDLEDRLCWEWCQYGELFDVLHHHITHHNGKTSFSYVYRGAFPDGPWRSKKKAGGVVIRERMLLTNDGKQQLEGWGE